MLARRVDLDWRPGAHPGHAVDMTPPITPRTALAVREVKAVDVLLASGHGFTAVAFAAIVDPHSWLKGHIGSFEHGDTVMADAQRAIFAWHIVGVECVSKLLHHRS
jgi:hypothetical protein